MLPNKKYTTPSLKKLKVDDLINLGNSHMCFMNIENIEKKKKCEVFEIVDTFFKSKTLEPILKQRTKTANETDLIEIGKNMNRLLNEVLQNIDIDHVAIENQISPIANRMKTIQGMLAQYFIMKNENIHIEFVSSSNKLKQFAFFDYNFNKVFSYFKNTSFICYPNLVVTEITTSDINHNYELFSKKERLFYSKCFVNFNFNHYHFIYLNLLDSSCIDKFSTYKDYICNLFKEKCPDKIDNIQKFN
jgi:hypothetical protein